MNDTDLTSRAPAAVPPPPGTFNPWARQHRPKTQRVPFRPAQLVAAALAAASVELARHSGPNSIGAALAVNAMAALVVMTRRGRSDWAWVAGIGALGLMVTLTSADWLVALDLTLSIALLAVVAGHRPATALSAAQIAATGRALAAHVPTSVPTAARQLSAALPSPGSDARARLRLLARSGLVASPIVGAVAVLVATADSLVRSWLDLPSLGPGPAFGVLTVSLAFWVALVLAQAHLHPAEPATWPWWRPSTLDALVTMAGVTVVLAGYGAVRLSAALAGSDYVQGRTGLTYAQYARAGFFQLLAAAAIALGAVMVTRTAPDGRWVRGLRLATGTTMLVLVGCVTHGFVLYQQAYGLTRLRISCLAALVWVTIVVIVVMAGEASRLIRQHTASAAIGAGVVVVVGLHLLNPDLAIARANLALAERTGRVDLEYLARLSPDAAPALADAQRTLDDVSFRMLREAWCSESRGGLAWNWALARAEAVEPCQ